MTSFPFLEIARDFGAPYQDVIQLADVIDAFGRVGPPYSRPIAEAICLALLAEHDRRKANSTPPKLVRRLRAEHRALGIGSFTSSIPAASREVTACGLSALTSSTPTPFSS